MLQDFTSDPDKITAAVKKISPYGGSTASHMVDAVEEATRCSPAFPQPAARDPADRRDARLRQRGPRTRHPDRHAVCQHHVLRGGYVPVVRHLERSGAYTRPDNSPPASHPMPSMVPATPTSVMQSGQGEGTHAEFIPLLIEIYKDVKGIFKGNPVEVFARGTGGSEFSYYRGHGLEEAIQRIGEQLQQRVPDQLQPEQQRRRRIPRNYVVRGFPLRQALPNPPWILDGHHSVEARGWGLR